MWWHAAFKLTDEEVLLRIARGILKDSLRPTVSNDDIDILRLGDVDLLHEGSDGMDNRGLGLGTLRWSSDEADMPFSFLASSGEAVIETEGTTERLHDRNLIGDVAVVPIESDIITTGNSMSLAPNGISSCVQLLFLLNKKIINTSASRKRIVMIKKGLSHGIVSKNFLSLRAKFKSNM